MKLYGSLQNRMMENQKEIPEIKVGMGVTEYLWSDRNAYEVTKVVNQKNVFIRRYDVKNVGKGFGDNSWELISDETNPEQEVVFRYGKWYFKYTITKESYDRCMKEDGYCLISDKEYNDIIKKGFSNRYSEAKITFGNADYYYDFEF